MIDYQNKFNDYEEFISEVIKLLEGSSCIVLATCANEKVTARVMSHINDDVAVMFQTGRNSEKASQIKANPCVALVIDNMQIEAVAEIYGHPNNNTLFIDRYKKSTPALFRHTRILRTRSS